MPNQRSKDCLAASFLSLASKLQGLEPIAIAYDARNIVRAYGLTESMEDKENISVSVGDAKKLCMAGKLCNEIPQRLLLILLCDHCRWVWRRFRFIGNFR